MTDKTEKVEETKEEPKKESKKARKFWADLKAWVWKYGGSLIMEPKGDQLALSLGRISFLCVFGLAMWMWSPLGSGSTEVPADMFTFMITILGYILGGKGVDALKTLKAPRK